MNKFTLLLFNILLSPFIVGLALAGIIKTGDWRSVFKKIRFKQLEANSND